MSQSLGHDPLCPAIVPPSPVRYACQCDLIAKAHRRGFLFGWGEGHEQGQRDMLAKCIAAVEALPVGISDDRFMPDDPPKYLRYYNEESVLTALRALQEKP